MSWETTQNENWKCFPLQSVCSPLAFSYLESKRTFFRSDFKEVITSLGRTRVGKGWLTVTRPVKHRDAGSVERFERENTTTSVCLEEEAGFLRDTN